MEGNYTIEYGITEDAIMMIKVNGFEEERFPGFCLFRAHYITRDYKFSQKKISYLLDPCEPDSIYIMPYVCSPGVNIMPNNTAFVKISLASLTFASKLRCEVSIDVAKTKGLSLFH
jgi:hypothetical protein